MTDTAPESPLRTPAMKRPPKWLRDAFADAPGIARHTMALLLSVISIWVVQATFRMLLGEQALFFDVMPVRWIFDAAHAVVLVRFVFKLARQIWNTSDKL
jgi:hypothetical protein